jgi:hypothetical protein
MKLTVNGEPRQVADDPNFRGGVRDYALDSADADRLWEAIEALIHPHIHC